MNWLQKKHRREVIILATGPGGEYCPFNKETWAVAKLLMTPKPQWRVDKLFCLDDVDEMLSTRQEVSTDDFNKGLEKTEKDFQDFVKETKDNLSSYGVKAKTKEEDGNIFEIMKKAGSQTEKIHDGLMTLTKFREELQYQNKFTR